MRQLLTIAKRLARLPEIFEQEARKEATRHQKLISKLNIDQLKQGEKADGTDMPPYAENSQSRHAPAKIKLWDTGDFYGGIQPLFEDKGFDLIGVDDKTNMLAQKYGKQILGLSKESQEELKKAMLIGLSQKIKRQLLK